MKSNFFDPYRQANVAVTPEERVRQGLLYLMTTKLGFPKQLIAVEKQLSELPHLKDVPSLPKRRIDILCFSKGTLRPLLLIECKKGGEEAEAQVMGYNHFIGAPFVAVARKDMVALIYPRKLAFLPSYSELMEKISG